MSPWIPVSERLPEFTTERDWGDSVDCIVCTDGGEVMAMTWRRYLKGRTSRSRGPRWEWMGRIALWEVTHWMPMPAPPTEYMNRESHAYAIEHTYELEQRSN